MTLFTLKFQPHTNLLIALIALCTLLTSSTTSAQWTEQATLSPIAPAQGDRFGQAVAISNNTILVGSPWNDATATEAGAAYLFDRSAANWNQSAILTPSDPAAFDQFGSAVSIRGDLAIIGAQHNDDHGLSSGSAYIFERSGTTFSEIAKLTASNAAPLDQFGHSVSIYGDSAIVGTYNLPDINPNAIPSDPYYPYDPATFAPGSAYIFHRTTGNQWSQVANLSQGLPTDFDLFGQSVSIFEDKAIIGASAENSYSGAAYIYERNNSDQWLLAATLNASDASPLTQFGQSVSITGDTAVIGASTAGNSGAAYVFERNTQGQWNQTEILTPQDSDDFSNFGQSVSVNMDAITIGAYNDDTARGSIHFYLRDEADAWTQTQRLTIEQSQPFDLAGISVAVSGNTAVAGAPGTDAQNLDSGQAHVITNFSYLCIDGDVNCDGKVGLLDLDILGNHYGQLGVTRDQGDLNLNGSVTLLDLDILGLHYGEQSTIIIIPEPSTLLLITLAGCHILSRRAKCA